MRAVAAGLALFAALLAGCGEEAPPPPPTRVIVVWDSVDATQLHACGAKHDPTPVLSSLARSGSVFAPEFGSDSSTAMVADVLGCRGVESIREPGRDRVEARLGSLAAGCSRSSRWITLGSVSQAHFDYAGLGLGFQVWHAPEPDRIGRPIPAEQVFGAVSEELAAALTEDAGVFLFLHFGDLRGTTWMGRADPTPWLDEFLAPWRGRGGIVDEGLAKPLEGGERASYLEGALLRRRGDERRVALLEALYAAELSRLDAVLGQVVDLLRRSKRFETAKISVLGLPAATPSEVEAREGPGPRASMLQVRNWELAEWEKVPRAWWVSGLGGRASEGSEPPGGWLTGVAVNERRSGRTVVQPLESGEPHSLRPDAQWLAISLLGEEGEALSLRATCSETELDLAPPGTESRAVVLDQLPERPPDGHTRRFDLSASQTLGIVPDLRGVDLVLSLTRAGLGEADCTIAGKPLLDTDLPVLLARRSPPWPEDVEPPALDLRPKGSREVELVVPGPEGAEVRLVVESFPPEGSPYQPVEGDGLEIAPHPYRWGATVVRGVAPLTAVIPRRPSSTRLGIALFVDGERVPAARMRYDDCCFRAPDELELGFGAAIWVEPAYRGAPDPDGTELVAIELRDPLPPRENYTPPTPAERALLQRLDDDE